MKKKLIVFSISVLFLASCNFQKPLYSWGNYDTSSYNYLKNKDKKSTQDLLESYKLIIEKQNGTRKMVPPGIYADYGFLLLQENRKDEGKAMLQKEIALYPESTVFINRILKMIE